ncbi:hypothetical protein ABI59_08295 [Acidobacteria bacterium Mor1]|nr:hypothetical protein ABI59_08295 [Acidobacteria bacterium Mor1]
MKGLGGFMVLMGAGSFVLNMMEREFTLLMWIDNWGTTVGMVIRIALIVVGAGLWFAGKKQEDAAAQAGDAG